MRPSSLSSVYMFGSGRIALDAICHALTKMDSSPRRLEITSPETKT